MHPLQDIVARHRAGEPIGITSICSAHPLVIEASFRQALRAGAPIVLIEATSNQVNQFGGYTGKTPVEFRAFVYAIADQAGFPRDRVMLGGDHLGPNAWQAEAAEAAMAKAETMVRDYVAAGFSKIHLDCSMACSGETAPLDDATVAARAARLCAAAEAAHAEHGGQAPVYVIGTEVPVPGGAQETLDRLAVTRPEDAYRTYDIHRRVFADAGLRSAWARVVAMVVQPGVEFDHIKALTYEPEAATELSALVQTLPGLVFEAHSTDYQPPQALGELVGDHFAILKVGPGVTFALREALWALDNVQRESATADGAVGLRETTLKAMHSDPRYWRNYYHAEGAALETELQYSLSDRIRYYWPVPDVSAAIAALLDRLEASPPPPALYSQYMPLAFQRLYARGESLEARNLLLEHIGAVLDQYSMAVTPRGVA